MVSVCLQTPPVSLSLMDMVWDVIYGTLRCTNMSLHFSPIERDNIPKFGSLR